MTRAVPLLRVRRAVALALIVSLAACAASKAKPDDKPKGPPEAGYVILQTRTVPLDVELPGRTAAYETADVRPQVSGVVQARLFKEGSIVHAGQTLYQIDPSLYRAAAAQAKANLASAQALQVSTRALADRYRPLARIEAISQQDLTNATATAAQATAAVAQTRAQLQTANVNLNFTKVPAPITGRIGRSLFTTGALVTAGQPGALTTIQRLDPIFVDIQQSSADILSLRRALARDNDLTAANAAVRLTLEDGSDYGETGVVEFSEVVVDPTTGTVTLRARFPNTRGLLLPGMYVRAHFAQAVRRDAVLAPQPGVTRDPRGNATALVVGPGNKAELRQVQVGQTIGSDWLITGGLKAGDRLIVEGLQKIKPGQPVKPVPAGSKPQSQSRPSDTASGSRRG